MQESEFLREEVKHKLTVEDMRNTLEVIMFGFFAQTAH